MSRPAGTAAAAALLLLPLLGADDLGKPGNDDVYGAGRVNARRAVGG